MARIGILTLSDKGAAGEREDVSGALLAERVTAGGHELVRREILPDDRDAITARLREWCDGGELDIVVTTGGTGLTARDVTPEATLDIAERQVPGLVLALQLEGLKKTPFAVLSRGVAVVRGSTLVVNLPGNPRAIGEGMDVLLPLFPHIADLLRGPVEHDA
jgi:molybdopterin adenylyltransferase